MMAVVAAATTESIQLHRFKQKKGKKKNLHQWWQWWQQLQQNQFSYIDSSKKKTFINNSSAMAVVAVAATEWI